MMGTAMGRPVQRRQR
uniref:Uncharacterized protein n=1 Tax=Arundo donax TaxID=35708 RepID=A0A0A9FU59_ARUDO